MEPIKEYSKYTRQVGYVLSANVVGLLLGLIQLPLLAKGLGAHLYGAWGLISAAVSFIAPFAFLGLTEGMLRFLAAETDRNKIREDFFSAFFITVFISGIAFALILFLVSDLLAASIFKDAGLSIYVKIGAIFIPVTCLGSIVGSYLTTFRKIGLLAAFSIVQSAVSVGGIAVSILLGYKLTGVIIAYFGVSLLFNLVLLMVIVKNIGFKFPSFINVRSYLSYGLPLTPTSAILWIISSSDRYMISYFKGVTDAGIYSAAYTISWYTVFLVSPITRLLFPTVAKSYDEQNLVETRNYMRYSLKYFLMIAIPSAFGLSILARPILRVLTTSEFISGDVIVPFIAFGGVLFGISEMNVFIIHLVKKTRLVFILLMSAALLNIVLNLILIPRLGIVGAAVATLISYGALCSLVITITRRYLKFDFSLTFILKSVFSAAVMALCIRWFNPQSTALIVAAIFGGAVIYFGVLLLIRGLSKEERAFFLNFVRELRPFRHGGA